MASDGGFGLFNWGNHGEDWEVRREMLAEESVSIDSDGRLLGNAFARRGFRWKHDQYNMFLSRVDSGNVPPKHNLDIT